MNEIEIIESKTILEKFNKIRIQHENVSKRKTPKNMIEEKMGFDYIKLQYMKFIADLEFPGWSWTIIKGEALGDHSFIVHGRLMYYDNGIKRIGDMIAAHRIQKKKDSNEYVDIGNDIKSANTDCMKKAFNTFMNIGDDIYQNEYINLNNEQIAEVMATAIKIDKSKKTEELINSCQINIKNYKALIRKMEKGIK